MTLNAGNGKSFESGKCLSDGACVRTLYISHYTGTKCKTQIHFKNSSQPTRTINWAHVRLKPLWDAKTQYAPYPGKDFYIWPDNFQDQDRKTDSIHIYTESGELSKFLANYMFDMAESCSSIEKVKTFYEKDLGIKL